MYVGSIAFASRPQFDDFVGGVALVEYGDNGADAKELRNVVSRLWTREFASVGAGEGTIKVRVDDKQSRYKGFRPLLKGRNLPAIAADEVRQAIQSQSSPINKGNKILISQWLRDF